MAESSRLDPFELWRDLIAQMEKGVNEFANQGMKTDEFAKGANKLMGANTARRKITRDLIKRFCEEFNLPTRSDVEAVNERLQSLEDRLVDIATTLRRLADAQTPAAAPGPARTRKPPTESAGDASAAAAAPAPARKSAAKRGVKRTGS